MLVVTGLRAQKRKGRVNVYLDGEFAFGADTETVVKHGLRVGGELDQGEVEKILKEGEFQKVYEKVVKFIGVRPRSEKELRDWCRRKKLGESLSRLVLEKMKRQGLVDDLEFARWWIEQRQTFRPRGRRLVEQELRRKGVGREVVDRVLGRTKSTLLFSFVGVSDESRQDGWNEAKLARKAAEKKLRTLENLSAKERRKKLVSFLTRRGFPWEVVREVVDELTKDG